jgi:hypothetical protein
MTATNEVMTAHRNAWGLAGHGAGEWVCNTLPGRLYLCEASEQYLYFLHFSLMIPVHVLAGPSVHTDLYNPSFALPTHMDCLGAASSTFLTSCL